MKGDNKYFFDSNVIIDAFSSREGSTFYSRDLLRRVASGEIKGCLCSKQITDIFYVLRKYIPSAQERKRVISILLDNFEVYPLLKSQLTYCINIQFQDYEDSIIYEVAMNNCVKAIITSNKKDFEKAGRALILSPKECYELIEAMQI